MAFVYEIISEEDFIKYDLATINERLSYGSPNSDWAIDIDREIWFRLYHMRPDRDNFGAEICTYWDFSWKGSFVSVETQMIKRTFSDDNKYYAYIEILKLDIPENIQQYKRESLKDLKEAFNAYYEGSCRSKPLPLSATIDLEYKGVLI